MSKNNLMKKLANLVEEHPEAEKAEPQVPVQDFPETQVLTPDMVQDFPETQVLTPDMAQAYQAPAAPPEASGFSPAAPVVPPAPPMEEPAAPEKPAPSPRQNKALIIYVGLLFCVAFVFVLVSLFVQQHRSNETINTLTQSANTAVARAEALQEENRQLSEDKNALTAENLQLKTDLETKTAEFESEKTELDNLLQQAKQFGVDASAAKEAAEAALANANKTISEKDKAAKDTSKAYEFLMTAQKALDEGDEIIFKRNMKSLEPLVGSLGDNGKALYDTLYAVYSQMQ